jgi:hypothetical protein
MVRGGAVAAEDIEVMLAASGQDAGAVWRRAWSGMAECIPETRSDPTWKE